ncbi:MAG: histidinol dehydrogenase [Verrucomicrobiota bacterium]|nr:histidinol dehydrogenase [Verrucomicrobiota bacterium]
MKIIKYTDNDFDNQIKKLTYRTAFSENVENIVSEMLKKIKKEGDKALSFYANKLDNVSLITEEFKLSSKEIEDAEKSLSAETKRAIETANENVSLFAKQRIPKSWKFSPRKGVILGERYQPYDRIACYIPGGTAPLVSTVIHTASIAKTAGVKEIVVTTPCKPDKSVHPAILYAAKVAGATEVYRLGGVFGIGALAYGTNTISKVDKIVGPGNQYVTAAKRHVYGEVALDMVAGPSEILVIADDTANPASVAADLLSQAEHGSGKEQAIFVSNSFSLIKKVEKELNSQIKTRKKADYLNKVYEKGIFLIFTKDISQAIDVANNYAPEHLEIMTENSKDDAKQIKAAGAIFIGHYTPECVGDFTAGPSHVLPTGGSATRFSGLTVEQFFRRMSTVEYSKEALKKELPAIREFAINEQLDAHGYSAEVRIT